MATSRFTPLRRLEHLRLQRLVILALFNIWWLLVVAEVAQVAGALVGYVQRLPILLQQLRILSLLAQAGVVRPAPAPPESRRRTAVIHRLMQQQYLAAAPVEYSFPAAATDRVVGRAAAHQFRRV